MTSDDRLLTVQDVYNVVAEHMSKLDELWPDCDLHGPRKIHIVELIDAIKLRLASRAEANSTRYESAFEKAAKKITGTTRDVMRPKPEKATSPAADIGKSAMQLAHEAAKSRIQK